MKIKFDEVFKQIKTRLRSVLDLRSHYHKSNESQNDEDTIMITNENVNLYELNVGQLKKLIKEMDDDTPIAIQASTNEVSRFVVATYDNDIFDEGCLLFTKIKIGAKNHYSI